MDFVLFLHIYSLSPRNLLPLALLGAFAVSTVYQEYPPN